MNKTKTHSDFNQFQNAVYNCKQSAYKALSLHRIYPHNKVIRSKMQHRSSQKVNTVAQSYLRKKIR